MLNKDGERELCYVVKIEDIQPISYGISKRPYYILV